MNELVELLKEGKTLEDASLDQLLAILKSGNSTARIFSAAEYELLRRAGVNR